LFVRSIPEGCSVEDIDRTSVALTKINEELLDPSLYSIDRPWKVGDHDIDGIPDLMVKFDAEQLIPLLDVGDLELAVVGTLVSGREFVGADTIRVINPLG